MKYWQGHVVATLAVLLVACPGVAGQGEVEEAAPSDEAAVEAIAAANERLLNAFLARDLDGWLAGLAEDVVLMPPGEFMIVGIEAVREASRAQFSWLEDYATEIEGDNLETVVAGSWAYTRSSYEARHQPLAGGEPVLDRARSLTIWERQPDGTWLVARHINNRPPHGPR